MTNKEKIVRTYVALPKFIDPAYVQTMTDLDLSYALASTLVEWDESRQAVGALSDRWDFPKPNIVRFHLRKNLKWSTGEVIKSSEVCDSLERAKEKYYNELKSLFDVIRLIKCTDEKTVEIETIVPVIESNILKKIAEPMYALVATDKTGEVNLAKTSGPFYMQKQSSTELVLAKNENWYKDSSEIPNKVELRQTPLDGNLANNFPADSWANLVTISSLQTDDTINNFKKNSYHVWQRNYDKIFFLSAGKKLLQEFKPGVLKEIADQIDIEKLLKSYSGFSVSRQFFPRGFPLHDPNFKFKALNTPKTLTRPLKILMLSSSSGLIIKDGLVKQIETITGHKPEIMMVKISELNEVKAKDDYDLLACNMAVDDPNFEGAMSFFFAGKSPFINSGEGESNFVERIAKAGTFKTDEDRIKELRNVMIAAVEKGYVAPLYLFTHIFVAKNGVSISKISQSKETVPYSLIRFE